MAASRIGCKCVFACEIKPELRELYEQNFGVIPEGDVRFIDPRKIPLTAFCAPDFRVDPSPKQAHSLECRIQSEARC